MLYKYKYIKEFCVVTCTYLSNSVYHVTVK
jgi:hypothetical protein